MKKRVHPFHHNIVRKHIEELTNTGETTIKSGFLLQIFKQTYNSPYQINKIRSNTTFGFYWSGTRHWKKKRYPNFKYILRLIDSGSIDKKETVTAWNTTFTHFEDTWYIYSAHSMVSLDEIDLLFDKKTTNSIRYDILDRMSTKYCKFGLISGLVCYKQYWKIGPQSSVYS
jgi:hypothetical protein